MVAQEGGPQMLDGMDFRCVHDRLKVWAGHTDIKGGDDRVPGLILAGDIDAWKKFQVVNGKAGYFFHGYYVLSENGFIGFIRV